MDNPQNPISTEEATRHYTKRVNTLGKVMLRSDFSQNSPLLPVTPEPPLHVPVPTPPSKRKFWEKYLPATIITACILVLSTGVFAFRQAQQPDQAPPKDVVVSKESKDTLPDRAHQPKTTPPTDNNAHKTVSPPPPTPTLQTYNDQITAATTLAEVKGILSAFGASYGITFSFDPPASLYDGFTFGKLAETDLDKTKVVGQIFVKEWSKYPKNWLHSEQYSTTPLFVFTSKVVDSSGVYRGGVYDNGTTIYFDIPTMLSVTESDYSYARATIHHEANHYAQTVIDGTVYYQDSTWLSYNPAGFTYGTTVGSQYYHPYAGFVSQYAQTNIAEDKAEVFTFIMTDQYRPALLSWLPGDSNLINKVQRIKQTMCAQWTAMCGSYYDTLQ